MRDGTCRAAIAAALVLTVWPRAISAFKLDIHRGMTFDVLYRGTLTSHGRPARFTREAVDTIAAEHAALDSPNAIAGNGPHYHCDSEMLHACNDQLRAERAGALRALSETPARIGEARWRFGRALHILQDFYSHTNWIELGKTGINEELGLSALTVAIAGKEEQTCSTAQSLAGAGLNKLTSGYAGHLFACEVPTGKCRHGNAVAMCPEGINKDDPDRPGHVEAVAIAREATRRFASDLLAEPVFKSDAVLRLFTAGK